ncbi:universal stress protein [Natronococcus occultus]|uniref:Universal stress protein UspA-like protein n=1 Tax=Natronococcus occultus SP4 TaxID=694430 RepID=L0JVY7_9EURY|nr:universal stress protein [Natronococcus occultus]AGB36921.1 universal stress protein UspA-like protein [Natronococcus occultus SP4]
MTDCVLVPVDGSPAAQSAAEYASEQFPDDSLTLLYVIIPMVDYSRKRAYPGYTQDDEFSNEREKGEHILGTTRETLPDEVSVVTEIEAGNPAQTIIRYAETNDVSQIVIGSHGKQGIARFLLGSVSETVVRRSPVPVTVVRPTE